MRQFAFFILALIVFFIFCDLDPSVVEKYFYTFTPLNIGDVTQLVFPMDSSTISFCIVGKTKRADNQVVFIGEWQDGTQEPNTFYYFLKDGYFLSTELDTIKDDWLMHLVNPFREQKLAKSQPHNGDVWVHTVGNSDSTYWIAKPEQKLDTFCGEFRNVYGFGLFSKYDIEPFLKTYYGLGIGWLGTAVSDTSGLIASCSYKKVGDKTFGELWPAKNPIYSGFPKKFHHQNAGSSIRYKMISGLFLLNGTNY